MPNVSLGFLSLLNTYLSIWACAESYWVHAWAQTPQISHSFVSLGPSSAYSRQLKGQTITHAPQLTHFPVAMTLLARASSKLVLF